MVSACPLETSRRFFPTISARGWPAMVPWNDRRVRDPFSKGFSEAMSFWMVSVSMFTPTTPTALPSITMGTQWLTNWIWRPATS
ncbi:MAG: hypothetical protein BWY88_01175 [Synergistetes bacterium ADurb.Bin520]|nr:MAG: hypothetical protein BWY88_01175 [Synergistetes bacterium ADurb.Bin520]